MKIGVVFPQTEFGNDPAAIRDYAQTAQTLGYNHILAYDHVLGANPDRQPRLQGPYTHEDPFHEPFVLFSFMAGWSEFIVARVILNRQSLYTLPLGLESLSSTFQTEWANYAAGSILVCIPVVVLFLLLSKFLISGLTLGGVKG